MKKKLIIIGGSIVIVVVALVWIRVLQYLRPYTIYRSTNMFRTFSSSRKYISHPEYTKNTGYIDHQIVQVVTGLEVPRSIVFTSPSRMLVTERPGRLRQVIDGVLQPQPLHVFTDISTRAEEGLMGMTLDPDYTTNKYIYLSYAYPVPDGMGVRVVRFRDKGDHLVEPFTVIDSLPAARFHAGSSIAFGPDGKLYVTVGDAVDRERAQDVDVYHGKILRIYADGSIPSDNPFSGSAIWSYGHRNPQGIDRNTQGIMYSSEHGPSLFDGPAGGDEINLIISGGNYGRPVVSHERRAIGMIDPLIIYTPAVAPASLLVYKGDIFPDWKDHIFVGALRGEGVIHIYPDAYDRWVSSFLSGVSFGRIRNVMQGPDGYIYFSTSNEDGRGKRVPEKDAIYRIQPVLFSE